MLPAIELQNLSKRYRIRQSAQGKFGSDLGDEIGHWLRSLAKGRLPKAQYKDFWGLRDISLTIQPGESVGLVGRNGAGKSTLLKTLSRIVRPTSGEAILRGRIGSLLEVGTGFHQDLSGRENIFLSGAILGMSRAEVRAKFDEIVEFANVGAFVDTPVKRYSSGMYMRLAFAVAAHLETEILLVDEVLAVGDAQFQRKCLGKMDAVSKNGRTVVFVSHNMSSVASLCKRGVVLDRGGVDFDGSVELATQRYLQLAGAAADERVWSPEEAPAGENVRLLAIRVISDG
ncbi:MAG TPA: ABC transporter ATP-binding protein, partial [Fibrobacteria bacterium]|nr:ABC transporter ATP-binding protein [Fibrobacteria bacterium]